MIKNIILISDLNTFMQLVLSFRADSTDGGNSQQKGTVFTAKLSRRLQAIQDIERTIQTMLAALDIAEGNPEALMMDEEG